MIQQEQVANRLSVEALCEVFYNRERLHSGIGYDRPVSRAV